MKGVPANKVQQVALLAEGVDRNSISDVSWTFDKESPSSRRAWIEIRRRLGLAAGIWVALLAEGVDRNVSPSLAVA